MPFNFENIKSWVMENVKNLKEFIEMGFDKTFKVSEVPSATRNQDFLLPTETGTITTSNVTPITPSSVTPTVSETTIPFPPSYTSTTSTTPTTDKKQFSIYDVYYSPETRKIFDELRKKGYFSNNPELSWLAWAPILSYANRPNKLIPSWSNIAEWQLNIYTGVTPDWDKIVNSYLERARALGLKKKGNLAYDRNDIENYIFAINFDTLYRMRRDLQLKLPPLESFKKIEDPFTKSLTKEWVTRVYSGYQLLGMTPPIEIQNLYRLASSEELSATKESASGVILSELMSLREKVENWEQYYQFIQEQTLENK